jgi:amidase
MNGFKTTACSCWRIIRTLIIGLAAELAKLGATVAMTSPMLPDLAQAARICVRLLVPLTLSRVSDEHYRRTVERVKAISLEDISLAAIGLRAGISTHRDWIHANESRVRLAWRWHRLFREWDVVVCPVSPVAAFQHDERPAEDRTLEIDGRHIPYFDLIAWASLATACGLPSTTIPFGRTAHGLPTGVELIGPHLEDATTIAFAEHLERHFGGFSPPPSFN